MENFLKIFLFGKWIFPGKQKKFLVWKIGCFLGKYYKFFRLENCFFRISVGNFFFGWRIGFFTTECENFFRLKNWLFLGMYKEFFLWEEKKICVEISLLGCTWPLHYLLLFWGHCLNTRWWHHQIRQKMSKKAKHLGLYGGAKSPKRNTNFTSKIGVKDLILRPALYC